MRKPERYSIVKIIVHDNHLNKDIEIAQPCFEVEDSQPGYKGYKEGPFAYLCVEGERIRLDH